MATIPEKFHDLPAQPDDTLKEGLKSIDSRLLKVALIPEPDDFIDKLLRGTAKTMLLMMKDDLDELRTSNSSTPAEALEAQTKIVTLYKIFLEKQVAP